MSWKCSNCGTENDNDNANFCKSCGSRHEHPAVSDETTVMPTVRVQNQPKRPAAPSPNRPPQNSGGNSNLKYVLIGVIVVLLGVIGGMVLMMSQKSDTKGVDKSVATQTQQQSSSSASSAAKEEANTADDKNKQLNVEDDGKLPGNPDGNEQEAANTLNKYYQSISNRNMQTAYNILSDDMQSHMGSLESFQSGYQTTLSNRISNVSVVSSDPGRVVLSYTLTSRDKSGSGVKVQTFQGTATMSSQSGSWHIVDLSVKKAGEHFE